MADHQHGTMDSRVQEKAFEGFVKIVGRSAVAILVFLLLLAIFNG